LEAEYEEFEANLNETDANRFKNSRGKINILIIFETNKDIMIINYRTTKQTD
jgi:hypothetical protein